MLWCPICTKTTPGIIQKTRFNNLSFAPSHIQLSHTDLELAQAFDNRSERLKRALTRLKDRFDYVIIDNPPSLGLLTINSFVASNKLMIPVSTGFFALIGLVQLQESIDMVKQTQLNPNPDILGVLCTHFCLNWRRYCTLTPISAIAFSCRN